MTIINRSEIVGRPLAAMLANDGATIYSIDVDSIFVFKRGALRKTEATPEEAVGQSDVVVTVRGCCLGLRWLWSWCSTTVVSGVCSK